jgi:hypothetical protein
VRVTFVYVSDRSSDFVGLRLARLVTQIVRVVVWNDCH